MKNTVPLGIVGLVFLSMMVPQAAQSQAHRHRWVAIKPSGTEVYGQAVFDSLIKTGGAYLGLEQLLGHPKPHDPHWQALCAARLSRLQQLSARGKALKVPPGGAHLHQTYVNSLTELDRALPLARSALQTNSEEERVRAEKQFDKWQTATASVRNEAISFLGPTVHRLDQVILHH